MRRGFDPWVGKIPWSSKWKLAPIFLPGKSLGQGTLVGYSPWGHKELDMTKRQSTIYLFIFSCAASSLLCRAFSSCGELWYKGLSLWWLLLLKRKGSRAQAQQLWCRGLVASQPVESSWTRDQPYVSCIGRQILKHWITREILPYILFLFFMDYLCLVKNYYKPIAVQYSSVLQFNSQLC